MMKTRSLVLSLLLCLLCSSAYSEVTISGGAGGFPDEKFRQHDSKNFYTNGDGVLSDSELAAVTRVNVSNVGVSSLKGIEHFTELLELDCSYNDLKELDVSANKKLEELYCRDNQLTAVDTRSNPELLELSIENNQIGGVDVSRNPKLRLLFCVNNKISALDVSSNTAIISLDCSANQITALDVRKNTAMTMLQCKGGQVRDAGCQS